MQNVWDGGLTTSARFCCRQLTNQLVIRDLAEMIANALTRLPALGGREVEQIG